ncbi:Uncharacterized protein APZ42_011879 [Daphnia magna]|uniref:Uncharacterized protein n=1 Tax=Daphnia magna TaxID=35525 RepID=A0A0P6BJS6_9CRUS|nr:Uncharacterized protein APZ42_011879 [Daphnia magna]
MAYNMTSRLLRILRIISQCLDPQSFAYKPSAKAPTLNIFSRIPVYSTSEYELGEHNSLLWLG